MGAEQNLKDKGIILPPAPTPKGNYVPAVLHNGILYLSGQGPALPEGGFATGLVGRDVTIEQAQQHARLTGLQLLAAARAALGNLDRVERVLNVLGMVNGAPDFIDHPKVINGFSDLMIEVFSDRGRHARAAVGMGTLPMRITVEIAMQMAVS